MSDSEIKIPPGPCPIHGTQSEFKIVADETVIPAVRVVWKCSNPAWATHVWAHKTVKPCFL